MTFRPQDVLHGDIATSQICTWRDITDLGHDVTHVRIYRCPHVTITRVTSQLVISLYDGGFEIMGVISCLDRDSRSGIGKATVLGAVLVSGGLQVSIRIVPCS